MTTVVQGVSGLTTLKLDGNQDRIGTRFLSSYRLRFATLGAVYEIVFSTEVLFSFALYHSLSLSSLTVPRSLSLSLSLSLAMNWFGYQPMEDAGAKILHEEVLMQKVSQVKRSDCPMSVQD